MVSSICWNFAPSAKIRSRKALLSSVGDESSTTSKTDVWLAGMTAELDAPSGDKTASLPLDAERETERCALVPLGPCGGVNKDDPGKEPEICVL